MLPPPVPLLFTSHNQILLTDTQNLSTQNLSTQALTRRTLKRLNAALYYVRRHFGFLRARRPPINSADELTNWAAVYGLEPRIGKLNLLSPSVRHAAAGLVEWSNQAYLIVVGRKSGYVRLKNPVNGKVLIMPESQFLRFMDNRIVWFLPQSVSEVTPVHNRF